MPPLDYPIKLCSLQLHWDDERVSQPYATRISSEFTFLKLKGTVPYCVLREACAHVYLLKLYLYASIREIQSREILSVSRLWAFSPCSSSTLLQSEHQMAEESFDSGVSSEHSQYTRDAKQQQQQICLNPVHQTHSVEELDGHYGPRLPQNLSCSQWQFNSEFHNRNSSRRRYLPPQGSFESSSDTDLLFASTSNLPTPQKSLQSLKEPNIRGSETSHTRDMSFNNPFDTPGSNRMHGFPINQGSSGNIREFNPRVVHFDREQTRGNERPALQSGLFSIEPSNSRVRLEEMQMYTPREEESTRYPYPRDYSTRDYARLPPMQHQPERTHPTGTPHPIGASVQSSTDRTNAYARDVNSLSTHPPFGASVSTHSTARQQASSILAALLTSQTRCTAPSLNENVPLQNITQRAGPSTSNLRRELLSARWSDSDMTAYGAHSLQQQQQQVQLRQQQQQQQMKLRQQQQQAAVAAAAAAAVAIAAIQGAPRSRSTVVTSPTGLTSTSVTFNPALARQTIRRSCYSSGDEEAFVTGVHGLGKDHEQQIHQFVSSPTIQSPPQPSDPSVRQQVLNQLAKLQSFSASADDYANYQTLEALLGRFHLNPPPPAPPQPPPDAFSVIPSTFDEESFKASRVLQPGNMTTGPFPPAQQPAPPPPPPPPPPPSQSQLTTVRISTQENTEPRLPEQRTEPRPEDKFSEFMTLHSERCLSTPLGTITEPHVPSIYDWSSPNPANPDTPGRRPPARTANISGLLAIHLLAGNGLSSSQLPLRDLYCVVEMDSMRKARSMIRTSTSYFEWNEVFELDMEENRFLAFLLYQWDPRTKHRLCFYGGVDLRSLVRRIDKPNQKSSSLAAASIHPILLSPALSMLPTAFEKIALQLEPRGVLYLEFGYYPLDRMFHRYQPTVSTSLQHSSISDDVLFGVPIDELVERERVVTQLLELRYPHTSADLQLHVPLFIRKCVEEIDRRGTAVVGIYRLAGSVWMKLQVRELFNRATKSMLRGIFRSDRKVIEDVISSIDLSPERVPDIHAITALFKDFLRELPEPLFTSALYPMFYDAMQVNLPGFSHNGAKLMLNILDCLPTINQEILLYLLDHFKRVTNQCVVNRMDTANLATCLAPVLFYPAPNSARNLDPAILEPSKMAEIFKFILDIWPDERTIVPPFESDVDVWTTELRRTRSPMLNEEFQADPQSAVYAPRRSHRRRHGQHRASSGTRSTLSGPASMGMRLDSPPQMQRTSHGYAGGHGGSERGNYAELGRIARVKFPSAPSPSARFVEPPSAIYMNPSELPKMARIPRSSQRKTISETDVAYRRGRHATEHTSHRAQPHPRFQELFATGSTDSGTRWSIPSVRGYHASSSGSMMQVKRGAATEQPRSLSHDRETHARSPRPPRRSHPYT